MDETSPTPPPVAPKRRGRKPKNWLAAKANETPSKSDTTDDTKATEKNDDKNDSIGDESMEKAEKPVKLSLSERKLARKAQVEAIIASGGRGKRTPKPNPKYMDEPAVSASKLNLKDDDEYAEDEYGDDEMNLSSDDLPRNEGPLKKRMLQKIGIKSGPGRKPGSGKGTPGRKPAGIIAIKRKIDVDIDIDDEHGKQLFLDAKRRFQNSPSNSEDDVHLKKSKSPVTDALAAKLRSKYPNDSFTIKRTVVADNKNSPINRVRLLERGKYAVKKDGRIELRQRKFTEETETSEDDFGSGRGTSDHDASAKNFNRRKTQHTKILSDDKVIRPSSSGLPTTIVRKQVGNQMLVTKQINKSPLTQSQLIQSKLTGGSVAKTYSISSQSRVIGSNKPAILRHGPPRILNSTLCKPTNKVTVPSLVTKVVTKDDYENELNKKRNNNIISSRSKENNVTSYVYTEKDGKMIPKKQVIQSSTQKLLQQCKTVLPVVRTPSTQQRIISEPVTMNIPNSRRIRKITCFETWYVIKMIEEQPKLEKSILNLSLMQIGNEIKKIELPSSEWNYKILLQPLNKQFLAMRQTKADEKDAVTNSKESTEKKADIEKPKDSDNKSDSKENDTKSKGQVNKDSEEEVTSSKDEGISTKTPKEDGSKTEETDSAASADEVEPKEEGKDDIKDEVKSDDEKEEEKAEPKSEKNDKNSETTDEEKEQKSEVLEKPDEKSELHFVYTGEVHDPNINPDEKQNYRPINIMFRRKCQNPNIRIQFDRTVILKNQTFYLNVDGKNVRLIASPQQIDTYDDISTLLEIVNDISLNSCCVELATHIG